MAGPFRGGTGAARRRLARRDRRGVASYGLAATPSSRRTGRGGGAPCDRWRGGRGDRAGKRAGRRLGNPVGNPPGNASDSRAFAPRFGAAASMRFSKSIGPPFRPIGAPGAPISCRRLSADGGTALAPIIHPKEAR